nr:MAG: replication associated protein [Cressdnaviricota sp.]
MSIIGRNERRGRLQGIFWMLTIPHYGFTPYLPEGVSWIRGQLERGTLEESIEGVANEGYLHWQIVIGLSSKKTLIQVRRIFGEYHAEITKSEAANEYVWKEQTRIQGTQFELGRRPFKRNQATDWDDVWRNAKEDNLMAIPADLRVRYYNTLRKIAADFADPIGQERTCSVFIGPTATGKSRRAWAEATIEAYPKDPRSKFWCGYRGQEHVVIDEFHGDIAISHLLRWLDRYPVIVEIKGSSVCLRATQIWITSNLEVEEWYPLLNEATMEALKRRLTITHFRVLAAHDET